jgi:hypothetical protein
MIMRVQLDKDEVFALVDQHLKLRGLVANNIRAIYSGQHDEVEFDGIQADIQKPDETKASTAGDGKAVPSVAVQVVRRASRPSSHR